MTDKKTFLDAIIAEPHNDAPRLQYADWLEQPDEPLAKPNPVRAQYIRDTVEIARMPADSAERIALEESTNATLKAHKREWVEEDLGQGILPSKVLYRRGFPETIAVHAQQFLDIADYALAHSPVTKVILNQHDREAPGVRQEPARLETARQLMQFFDSPHLQKLEKLEVSHQHNYLELPVPGAPSHTLAQHMIQSPNLCNLKSLNLTKNQLQPAHARLLASSPHLKKLEKLDISDNPIDNAGLKAIVQSGYLTNLHTFGFANTDITSTGLLLLTDSTCKIKQFKSLDLSRNQLRTQRTGNTLVQFFSSPRLAGLTELNLNHTNIDNNDIVAIPRSPALASLECLRLDGTHASLPQIQLIYKSPFMSRLQELDLEVDLPPDAQPGFRPPDRPHDSRKAFAEVTDYEKGALQYMRWFENEGGLLHGRRSPERAAEVTEKLAPYAKKLEEEIRLRQQQPGV